MTKFLIINFLFYPINTFRVYRVIDILDAILHLITEGQFDLRKNPRRNLILSTPLVFPNGKMPIDPNNSCVLIKGKTYLARIVTQKLDFKDIILTYQIEKFGIENEIRINSGKIILKGIYQQIVCPKILKLVQELSIKFQTLAIVDFSNQSDITYEPVSYTHLTLPTN